MGDNKDEDDKPTVMLNLDELKKQNEFEATGVSQILEFSAIKEALSESAAPKPKCILFDFNSTFFQTNITAFNEVAQCQVVTDVKELNKLIVANKEGTFLFYFNDAGKQINALLAQINQKFPKINSVLIAKNLSENKAQQHSQTASGAKSYLSWPSDSEKIKKAVSK